MAPCESAGWHVQVQLPVTINEFSAPEPDIAVVQGTEEDFAGHPPGPEDLILVVEIADSSLDTDRSTKHRLHATVGVPRYWLINLQDSQVEVFEQPDSGTGR
jgi:Uma2 family endonuclease